MRVRLPFLLMVALLVFGMPHVAPGHAQPGAASCSALAQLAIERVSGTCSSLERNSACYGFNQVDATFTQQVEPEFFQQPADRGALHIFDSIQTAALDLALEQWGVAVLSAQANIPSTLPGQSVTFLLMGDVAVENDVPADEAIIPIDPINVIMREVADIHLGPTSDSAITQAVNAGTVLEADALGGAGDWLRIRFAETIGWVPTPRVSPSPAINNLPILTPQSRTPMQAFTFQTGIGSAQCNEAPSVVAVQSPEGLMIDLTVNGADIRVGSTIIMQSISEQEIALLVQTGNVQTDNSNASTGQAIMGMLGADGMIMGWSPPRAMTPEEQQLGQMIAGVFGDLNGEDDNTSSSPPPPQNTSNTPNISGICGPNALHIVGPGENLFRIAQGFRTTIAAIVNANNIGDRNVIVVGQVLRVPCSTGNGNFSPSAAQQSSAATIGGVDCTGFYPTSPRDGMPYGTTSFFWDLPAAGNFDGFHVNIYDEQGVLVGVFPTDGGAHMVHGNMAAMGTGFVFAWEVVATVNGQMACTTERVSTLRASSSNRQAPAAVSVPAPNPICGNYICEPGETPFNCSIDCP